MPAPSPLQVDLLNRQPELNWLLDANNNINALLFDQWGLKLLQHYQTNKPLNDVKDAFLWALEQKVEITALQNTFDWLHKTFVIANNKSKEASLFFSDLKQKYPEQLQHLLSNASLDNSVWNTAFLMQYAPDPKKMWDSNPKNATYYNQTAPLAWCKKETTHDNCSACAYPTEETVKTMHNIMGPKAFAQWQYGAFMHLLSMNMHSPIGPPSGKKYGAALALEVMAPAIRLGLAPDPKEFALDTVKRYKGRGLVEDLMRGIDYAMDQYEESRCQEGLDYCSTVLNNIIPFAIQDGLARDINSMGIDTRMTQGLHAGRLDPTIAEKWFEDRLTHGRAKRVLSLREVSPPWPLAMKQRLFALDASLRADTNKTEAQNTVVFLQSVGFDPAIVPVLLDTLSDTQWSDIQHELDNNDATSNVVALLRTQHPRVDAYKNSPRARTAITAACMFYVSDFSNYHAAGAEKYRSLSGLLFSGNQQEVGKASLPQPLAYFASCFPQYRETWQSLAQDMAVSSIAQRKKLGNDRIPAHTPSDARQVINAVASLMLGKTVDAQNLLEVRNMLDSTMSYEALVQTQMNVLEEFQLPETFNASIFADNLSLEP